MFVFSWWFFSSVYYMQRKKSTITQVKDEIVGNTA